MIEYAKNIDAWLFRSRIHWSAVSSESLLAKLVYKKQFTMISDDNTKPMKSKVLHTKKKITVTWLKQSDSLK